MNENDLKEELALLKTGVIELREFSRGAHEASSNIAFAIIVKALDNIASSLGRFNEWFPDKKPHTPMLDKSVDELRLGGAIRNTLYFEKIDTLALLTQKTPKELAAIRGISDARVDVIRRELLRHGLKLKGE